jgi:transketolase
MSQVPDITRRQPQRLTLPALDGATPRNVPSATLEAVGQELRLDIVEMITRAQSGHPGGSFSATNLVCTLLLDEMRHRPHEPRWPLRDRLVLSKGHAVPALYAALSRLGYLPREELWTLRKMGSRLQGHPANQLCPGIEASTGSLGQGLSVAQGMALAGMLEGTKGRPAWRVYCITGDGELQEGQVWEAAMSAPRHKVANLCVLVDANQGQIDGLTKDVMDIEPLMDKWRSFNWHALTVDGHSVDHLKLALAAAREERSRPTVIIARTHKGVGAKIFERDMVGWHGKAPSRAEADEAIQEILRGLT